jgi:hypothetical protein
MSHYNISFYTLPPPPAQKLENLSSFFISHHFCEGLFLQRWQMTLCFLGNWDGKLGSTCYIKLSLVSNLIECEGVGLLEFLLLYFPRRLCDRKFYFKTNCDLCTYWQKKLA